jgi:hypothetical protein
MVRSLSPKVERGGVIAQEGQQVVRLRLLLLALCLAFLLATQACHFGELDPYGAEADLDLLVDVEPAALE